MTREAISQPQARIGVKSWVKSALSRRYLTPRQAGYTEYVSIGSNVMNLRELDEVETVRSESSVRGAVNVYDRVLRDTRNTNVLRRMWSFMEPDRGPCVRT